MSPVCAATKTVDENGNHGNSSVLDEVPALQSESNIPAKFIWPENERPRPAENSELAVPVIDLQGFFTRDEVAISTISELINEACKKHGFFLVANHSVDLGLIAEAHKYMDWFFSLPLSVKQKAPRKPGENYGFASSFPGRFSSRLPWKETLSFPYSDHTCSPYVAQGYILDVLGENFRAFGKVFQEYCEAMNNLSLGIMELLGLSLGVGRQSFKDFYEGNDSVMRLNYYPPCPKPDLTLGTGPHCDTTSLTILHQDQVGGLEVFVDGKWHFVRPLPHAFVINIGDTFMAQTNNMYKSCLHRAVVNSRIARKSIGFFLCPKVDKVVRPPESLITVKNPRLYPDFTWQMLLEFTQKHYRPGMESTLHAFFNWL